MNIIFYLLLIYFYFYTSFKGKVLYKLFMDNFSLIFILLSLIMFMLMLEFMPLTTLTFFSYYKYLKYFLLVTIMLFFSSKSLFYFYVFFEFSVMPMFLIMLCWGSNPERIKSSFYLFIYTLMGSMPLLFSILYMSLDKSTFKLYIMSYYKSTFYFYSYYYFSFQYMILLMIMSFCMKLPLFGVHYWLPKAHVEAPSGGSMSLASLMLKMGGYGLYRFKKFGLLYSSLLFKKFYLNWLVLGNVILGMMVYRLMDLKKIMAYSSIVHMSFCFMLFFKFKKLSFMSFFILLVSHGFISSFLFYYIGYQYSLTNSRSMLINTGYLFFCLSIIYLFLFLLSNMAFPPFLSYFSEYFAFNMVLDYYVYFFMFMLFNFVCIGLYKMYMYSLVSHGKNYKMVEFNYTNTLVYYLGFFYHFVIYILLIFTIDYMF